MREIFLALKEAQSASLIHRDLRADNILVKQKLVGANVYSADSHYSPYSVHIINFGANVAMDNPESMLDKFGFSRLYCLAPEQISKGHSSLYYTDVWACGILLFIMFSGSHPFKSQTNYEFCKRVLTERPSFSSKEWMTVSKSAKTLIQGMLVKNPQKRLSILELLSSKWIRKYCLPTTKRKQLSIQSTKNLMLFNSERKLEQALQSFINNKISTDSSAVKLLRIFEEMD